MKTGKNPMYRMPVFFGPGTGPRRGPDGNPFDGTKGYDTMTHTISFLGNADQLKELLPPKFELYGDPIFNVFFKYMKNIEWLAGRGYNLVGVNVHAVYKGEKDTVPGTLLLVLWENMNEPILTGREELGYSKIYCEIPDPMRVQNTTYCNASWDGFRFFDFTARDWREPTEAENREFSARTADLQGNLHYKYIPATGDWGKAAVEQAILGPKANPEMKTIRTWTAEGTFKIHRPTWQDMPTQWMIINALADLEVKKVLGTRVVQTVGSKDLSDMKPLK